MTNLLKSKKIIILIFSIIIVFVFCFIFKDVILKMIYQKNYEEIIVKYSEKYQVDENLIFAIIKTESNFDKDVSSNKGAVGLMQLMTDTAKEVALKNDIELDVNNIEQDLLNPEKNIEIGTKYAEMMIKKYENIQVALAAYNAGTGTVDNWIEKGIIKADGSDIENIPFKETNMYVRKILRDYEIYAKLYRIQNVT